MQKRSLLYIGNKLSQKGIPVTSIETLGNFLEKEGCFPTEEENKNLTGDFIKSYGAEVGFSL